MRGEHIVLITCHWLYICTTHQQKGTFRTIVHCVIKIRIKLIHVYLEFLRIVVVPVDIADFIKCEHLSHTSRLYMAEKLI